MTYQVHWRKEASDELASIWLAADHNDRRAVTQAASAIDRALATDPDQRGESRSAGRRIFFCAPLGVIFQIMESQGLVYVLQIWRVL